jgi:monoterpene epsilon-lactone hydrolase
VDKDNSRLRRGLAAQFLVIGLVACASPPPEAPPRMDQQGVIRVPEFRIPLSRYMSPEARRLYTDPPSRPSKVLDWRTATIEEVRASHDEFLTFILARIRADYPVEIADRAIAGVATRVITPPQGVAARNKHRVLLNLHGGGFFMGANAEALVESIPVAAVAGIPVITVDYRQGPEHRFPAASDDVIAVYRELLNTYPAGNIGIYGCSAGGSLAAITVAALQKTNLSAPGAIGIFSAGAYAHFSGDPSAKGTWGGDSRFWAPPVLGQPALSLEQPPFTAASAQKSVTTAYISNVDPADPFVSPAESPELLAKFPPTLVLTGTRAYDMSAVIETHRQLIRSGAQAELHLWDGLGHCFFFESHLPESKEAYDVMAKFFDKHLGTGGLP